MEPFAGCSNVLSFYIEKFIVSLSNKSFKQTNYENRGVKVELGFRYAH